jgi:hypothetical protein
MRVLRNTPKELILDDTPWIKGATLTVLCVIIIATGMQQVRLGEHPVWVGLLFIAIGTSICAIVFCLFIQRARVVLDRLNGRVAMHKRTIFRSDVQEFSLNDLIGAELEHAHGPTKGSIRARRSGTVQSHLPCRPVLVIHDFTGKNRHPIIVSYSKGQRPRRLATAVNDWLGPVRVDSAPPKA